MTTQPYRREMIALITGPVRSGKSARALEVSRSLGALVTYVATARIDVSDPEMIERVARHRTDRGDMPLVELWQAGGPDLPAIITAASTQTTLLIDSLGTWVAGHLLDFESLAESDAVGAHALLEARTHPFLASLRATAADIVIVSEETGWGLVPPSALGRIFRDCLGRLTQQVGRIADRCELVVAGYAIDLKACGVPLDA